MTYYNRKKLTGIVYMVSVFFLIAGVIGNYFAFTYSRMVSQFFNEETFRMEGAGDAADTTYYENSYTKLADLIADETAFSREIQKEGVVLLQNTNLPLASTDVNVALLGATSKDSVYHSGGSGSGAVNVTRAPQIADCFEEAGFTVNQDLLAFYEENGAASGRTTEEPNASLLPDFSAEVGVVFIGRSGGESLDLTWNELQLSEDERSIIDLSLEKCEKTVVLLNTSNPVEIGYLEDKDASVLWVGASGEISVGLIPEILKGIYNPSGRLVDTYAYDNTSNPVYYNYGDYTLTNVEDETSNKYVNYAESIYYGYRYYETRYADRVMGVENVGDYEYVSNIQYPFGYGLSYTQFDYSDYSVADQGDTVELSVTVTNAGTVAGKEVVQFYMQSPYTDYDRQNGIEKSAIQLVGFVKTSELEPGAAETISYIVDKQEMRAYDSQNAKTYIVDAGDYYFATGKDVHDALNNILAVQGYNTENGMTAEGNPSLVAVVNQPELDANAYAVGTDGTTAITNQFGFADIRTYMPESVYMTRSDWAGTFPTAAADMEAADDMIAAIPYDVVTVSDIDESQVQMPATGETNDLLLASMISKNEDGVLTKLDYNDEKWDLLLNEMSAAELMDLYAVGGYGTVQVSSINKPISIDRDGPASLNASMMGGTELFAYPSEMLIASTWNTELVQKMGEFIGEDGLLSGVQGWYAPGINVHRSPAAGRNFEYYSEDPVMSGLMSDASIKGAQSKGLVVYIKHFALNEQEVNRATVCTFATEQAIREIYLRPFEESVVNGEVKGIMNSMNRIGMRWAGACKELLTNVTRDEWGFQGIMITDAAMSTNAKIQPLPTLLAGSDLILCPNAGTFSIDDYETSATTMTALREAAHRVLYSFADSAIMNGMTDTTTIVEITPTWQKALIAVDVVLGLIIISGCVFMTVFTLKKKKANDKENRNEKA